MQHTVHIDLQQWRKCRDREDLTGTGIQSAICRAGPPKVIHRFSPKRCAAWSGTKSLLMLLLQQGIFENHDFSLECGYADLSHMNRELKSVLGVMPKMVGREDLYLGSMKTSQTVYNFRN